MRMSDKLKVRKKQKDVKREVVGKREDNVL